MIVLFAASASAAPSGLPDVKAQKAAVKCQKAIDQTGAKLFAAELKSIDACSTAVLACIETKPGDAKCLGKAGAACDAAVGKLATARGKLQAGIAKKCGDTGAPAFATLAAPPALNLDALADDCTALGVGPLCGLDDYVACVRREHECRAADLVRSALPRTAELLDAGLLGNGAGPLLDASQCPPSLPSESLLAKDATRNARFFGSFSSARFFTMTKLVHGGRA